MTKPLLDSAVTEIHEALSKLDADVARIEATFTDDVARWQEKEAAAVDRVTIAEAAHSTLTKRQQSLRDVRATYVDGTPRRFASSGPATGSWMQSFRADLQRMTSDDEALNNALCKPYGAILTSSDDDDSLEPTVWCILAAAGAAAAMDLDRHGRMMTIAADGGVTVQTQRLALREHRLIESPADCAWCASLQPLNEGEAFGMILCNSLPARVVVFLAEHVLAQLLMRDAVDARSITWHASAAAVESAVLAAVKGSSHPCRGVPDREILTLAAPSVAALLDRGIGNS